MSFNSYPLNFSPIVQMQQNHYWSSWDFSQKTPYAFLSSDGMYYNFHDIPECKKNYGNFITKHNLKNTPKRKIETYVFPQRAGGKVTRIHDAEIIFNIELSLQSDSRDHLDTELARIKHAFHQGGILVYKNRDKIFTLPVIISDPIEIGDVLVQKTDIRFVFASYAPYWQEENIYMQSYPKNSGNTEFSFFIPGDIITQGRVIVNIQADSPQVQTVQIRLNDGVVTFQTTFKKGDILEVNTTKKEITKNTHVIPYTGIIPNIQSGKNTFQFSSDSSLKYDLHFLFKNNIL